jgi:hypothetical protein
MKLLDVAVATHKPIALGGSYVSEEVAAEYAKIIPFRRSQALPAE